MRNSNEALIVVDVQNDFCPDQDGALQVPNGHEVVPVINSIWPLFQKRILTRDYHPKGHGSFASSHDGMSPFESTMLMGLEQTLWPDHCIQGTGPVEFHPDLNTDGANLIISKGMKQDVDSYSAFLENDGSNTGLANYLEGIGVDTVYVTGLAGDYCAGDTAIDANGFGFKTIVVEDAVRSINEGNWKDKKEIMSRAGIRFIQSSELTG